MSELMRDPAWQAIGAIIGVIAACIIYILQKQRKELSYKVISIEKILTINEELAGRLQVLYDGKPARDITLISLQLINSGTTPIATSDYEEPISLSTGRNSKVLSTVITKIDPDNLQVIVDLQCSNLIKVEPVLLNSKDSITLKILVSDFCGTISVKSRIIGVKAIKPIGQSSSIVFAISSLASMVVGTGAISLYFPGSWIAKDLTPVFVILGITVIVINLKLSITPVIDAVIDRVRGIDNN